MLGVPRERAISSSVYLDKEVPIVKSIWIEVINGKTYLMISISNPSEVAYVKVGNSHAELYNGNEKPGVYFWGLVQVVSTISTVQTRP